MQVEDLMEFGLTLKEANVYLALLALGSASISDIIKEAKVHRVSTYDILKRLISKGLVGTIIKTKQKIYQPAPPSELIRLIEQKKHNLQKIIPSLESIYNSRKQKENVYHFEGPDGILIAYYMMLSKNETIYALGGSGLNRKILGHRHEKFEKDLIKRKIHIKGLYYESFRKKRRKSNLWEIRYLPNEFQSPSMVDICGDMILILMPNIKNNDILGIVIENKSIADSYKNHFKFMWKFAKK